MEMEGLRCYIQMAWMIRKALEISRSQRTRAAMDLVQKCLPHLSPILIFSAVYGGLHQDCFGQKFFKYARWWFQTCLYVQPPFREDSHFDDRIFSDGLKPQPPSSRTQEVKSQKPKKALPTDCDVPWRWMKIRPLGSVWNDFLRNIRI